MNNNRNLKWGIVLSYVNTIAAFLISILYTPFLLRSLGQQQYGLFNMGQAAVSYLSLAEFGFGNAVVRYSAKYRAEGNKEKEAALYGVFLYLYWILAAIIFIVGLVVCFFSDRFYTVSTGVEGYHQLRIIILIMVASLTFTFATAPFSSIITAYERYSFSKIINLLYTILKPLTMIPLLIWGYKAIALSLVTLILTAIMHIANIVYVNKRLKIHINLRRKELDFKILHEIIGYSFFIFLGTVVGQLNNNTDNIILGVIFGEAAVAVYSIGYMINTYIQILPTTVSSVFFPRVTMRITQGASIEAMSTLFIRMGRLTFFISFLVSSGFILFGQEFIRLWAGEEYYIAYWIAIVISLPHIIPDVQVIGVQILQAMNRHQFRSILYVICAVLNVALSIPAGLRWGPLGCAVCTGVATLITSGIIMNWYYATKIHLNIINFWSSIVKLFFRLSPILIVGIIIKSIFPITEWISLVFQIVIYTICYGLLAYFVAMNTEEKGLVRVTLGHLKYQRRK